MWRPKNMFSKSLHFLEDLYAVATQEKLEAVSAVTPPTLRRGRFSAPDQLIEMLTSGTKGKDYAKQTAAKSPWIGPRRRLTVHNQELC